MTNRDLPALEAEILGELIVAAGEEGRVIGDHVAQTLLRYKGVNGVASAMRRLANMGYISWINPGTGDIAVSDAPNTYPQCA